MFKSLTIVILVLACMVFENSLLAQGMAKIFSIDSAQQFIVNEMGSDLIKWRIKTVSEKQKVIDEAKAWKSYAIHPRMSVLQNSEKMKSSFSRYILSDTIALHQTLKSTSFSDPANSLQMLTVAKEGAFASELKSMISMEEVTSHFMTNSFWKTNARYFSSGSETKESISPYQVNVKSFEDKFTSPLHELTDIQNSSTKEINDEVLQMKRVYSEKMLKKIYDSIGSEKIDSLVQVASKLSKQKMTENELLEVINNSFSEYHKTVIDTTQLTSFGKGDLTSLSSEFQQPDLTKLILTDSTSQSLPKININQIELRYLKTIDSIRLIRMKYESLSLSENLITQNIKAAIIRQKPKVLDRMYFDGVLGVLLDGKGTILKISPSLGYNISNFLSIGLGPSFLLNNEGHEWNGKVGVRSFLKGEFWRQRMYIQLEDNIDPIEVNAESISQTKHSVLAGGGCLLPISKTMAINPSIFYRINNSDTQFANGSPWVFRMGISSISKKPR